MKNLKTYDQFILEAHPVYSFDGEELKVGSSVQSSDGFSGVVVSKETTNGKVKFRDSKGIIHICESRNVIVDNLNEGMKWWEITKGILASDALKTGVNFIGGGVSLASHLFPQWRTGIADKLEKMRASKEYQKMKDVAFPLMDKINNNPELSKMINQLAKHPHISSMMFMSSRDKAKAEKNNAERKSLMMDIAKHVDSLLTPEEKNFFNDINNMLKTKPLTDEEGKKIEEDATTDPNRTVGTGTYTSTHSDPNFAVKGYHEVTDPSSAGSHPTYLN